MEPILYWHSATDVLMPLVLRAVAWGQLGIALTLAAVLAGVIAASHEGKAGR